MASSTSPTEDRRGTPVLSFADSVIQLSDHEQEILTLQTEFFPGEFIMIHSQDEHYEEPLVQAICGLLAPGTGIIKFHDHDWQALEPDQANAHRGRIGIAFGRDSWIPYWSIMDNLMLPHLHHTNRPADSIRREVAGWAAHFGLPGVPKEIPMDLSDEDRQRANLARAFIGEPSLIIIEHSPSILTPRLREALVNAIRTAREHDACVIWISRDISLSLDVSIPATRRLELGASTLLPLEMAA